MSSSALLASTKNPVRPEPYRIRSAAQRRINLKTFPYYLPFIIREETVWVLAVVHESRHPRYWISRRPPIPSLITKEIPSHLEHDAAFAAIRSEKRDSCLKSGELVSTS